MKLEGADRQFLRAVCDGASRRELAAVFGGSQHDIESRVRAVLQSLAGPVTPVDGNRVSCLRLDVLCGLRALWDYRRASDVIPPYTRFTFRDLQPWIGHLAVLKASPDGRDMFIRVVGRHITAMMTQNTTCHWMSEILPEDALQNALRPHLRALRSCAPQYEIRTVQSDDKTWHNLHRFSLPCAGHSGRPELVLAALYLDPKIPSEQLENGSVLKALALNETAA